jgi:hypothetical protein
MDTADERDVVNEDQKRIRPWRIRLGFVALLAGALLVAPLGLASANAAPASYTCSGGTLLSPVVIPAGTYGSVTIADGICAMQGNYTIKGGLTVEPGAFLDAAVFFGFPPYDYGAACNVSVSVSGGVTVGQGAALYFGNGAGTGCPSSNDVIKGGLRATGAESIVVHGTTINGGMTVIGGGGGTSCSPTDISPFGPYTNLEDSHVNGGVSISGLSTCWIGVIRNEINGGLQINNNTLGDTDAIEVGINSIHGTMACSGNQLDPAVPPDLTPGDHAGNGTPTNYFDGQGPFPNTVTGRATGQCTGL